MDLPLTSLEYTALGIILKRGPCVAHIVVKEFGDSHTQAYRSGAGSVYPLMKRLHEAGLLSCTHREYSLTEAGLAELKKWLQPPFDPSVISTNLDLIRSRTYFLRLLTEDEIASFIDFSQQGLHRVLEECRNSLLQFREMGDKPSEFAMLGAVRETESRIKWLEEVRSAFC